MPSKVAENGHLTAGGWDFGIRLRQTFSVLYYLFLLAIQPFAVLFFIIFCPLIWPLLPLYALWFFFDFRTPFRGSRFVPFLYNSPVWRHVADYFPIKVHKTAEIPPNRNYVFSAHPHGVLGSSSFLSFGTGGTNFGALFPQIKMHTVTLDLNFWIPIRREFVMANRMIPSDKGAIEWVLNNPAEGGNAIGIVPGGAAEALESYPNQKNVKLVLAHRKGFIKLAIKHGAWLVPVYHFGETELYGQVRSAEGSTLRTVQNLLKRWTSISFPLAYGQNCFAALLPERIAERVPWWMRVGVMPYRHQIATVVGEPIEVVKDANPSEQLVNKLHAKYCARLRELFNAHKVTLGGMEEGAQLEFI